MMIFDNLVNQKLKKHLTSCLSTHHFGKLLPMKFNKYWVIIEQVVLGRREGKKRMLKYFCSYKRLKNNSNLITGD